MTGQVKSLDGTTLSLSTARDVTTVLLNDSTVVQQSTTAAVSDLQAGQQVLVTGSRDSSGKLTASQILILSTP